VEGHTCPCTGTRITAPSAAARREACPCGTWPSRFWVRPTGSSTWPGSWSGPPERLEIGQDRRGVSPAALGLLLIVLYVAGWTLTTFLERQARVATLSPIENLTLFTAFGWFVLLALTILVAMIGIANTVLLSIVERRREIGLTRAVGATRAQVRTSIRWEALLISAFGLMAALAVGVFFGWIIVQALEEEGFSAFYVPGVSLAAVTAFTAALTFVAALVPAWWGARRPVLPAIANE
jgi:hypothetical protein